MNVPPILAARIFLAPGQQDGFWDPRFQFFHSFPLIKGGEEDLIFLNFGHWELLEILRLALFIFNILII